MEYDMDDLKRTAEMFLDGAVVNLKVDGGVLSTIILVKDDDMRIALLHWNNDHEKYILIDTSIRYAKEFEPDAAFFISEAWSKEVTETEPSFANPMRPSAYPDKKEVLVIMAVSCSSKLSIIQSFTRLPDSSIQINEGDRTFMEEEKNNPIQTLLDPIFEHRKAIHPKPITFH